ncbi:nucleoid occlusion factor SlmA [Teredinibacter haidensis]|uniref:nucleoid occlusion factor SlmA n=1 Tax=Teredinibacter haidensis TaxID=2731755 RepID=UPI000948B5D1|nr:nucleoid occlusion factor SlmA [Teredinibacter haidensis]
MNTNNKKPRRQQILEALAHMLEVSPGARITTAALAKEVGVSEAALYRHFPSKSKMYEGLIEFIEETLFSRISIINSENENALLRCEKMLHLVLAFSERNPGITRILTGDALAGETDRLRLRVIQLFERLETQLRQIFREAELKEGLHFGMSVIETVGLLMALLDGKMSLYVRSEFKRLPTANWPQQWHHMVHGILAAEPQYS